MSEAEVRRAFLIQEGYCTAMDAPITARVCRALSEGLDRTTTTGRRALDWPGEPTADALPLRLVGPAIAFSTQLVLLLPFCKEL